MKLGFIGTGNMGGAIVKAIINKSFTTAENVLVLDKNASAQEFLVKGYGVNSASSYEDIISKSDILFIGVKPNACKEVYPEIAAFVDKYKPLIVSMAAGITLESIEAMLGFEAAIIRIMPNINAAVAESTTALCANKNASAEHIQTITACLNSVGRVFPIEENYFSIFAAIACCSPAFTYMFIDSLARGAQKLGMNKRMALDIAAASILGSAKMVLDSQVHPYELIDKVCSPGGSTIEGVCTLSCFNFETALVSAVEACVNKDKLLSQPEK